MASKEEEDILDSLFPENSSSSDKNSNSQKARQFVQNQNKSKNSVLSTAISELEEEISVLTEQRDVLKKSIERASSSISSTRKKESELQKILALLADKEMKLAMHKKDLENKSENITQKLGKMSRIMSEMKDI